MNSSSKNAEKLSNDSNLLAVQTSQLYGAVTTALIATVINSIILTLVLWSHIEQQVLVTWLCLVIVLSLIRGYSAYRYKHASTAGLESASWRQLFLLGSITSACIWGLASIILFPSDNLPRQVFLAFVIGGMAAGSIISLSYVKVAIYSFLLITMLPLVSRFFTSREELSIEMGVMLSLFLVVLLQSAKQAYARNEQNITMKFTNREQGHSLDKSERRYKTLIETASDAFFLHDSNGKILDVNQQACNNLGYTKDELLAMSVFDIEVTVKEKDLATLWAGLNDGDKIQAEGTHIRKDGSRFPVEVSLGMIHVGDESFLSVLARDVTERKRIEKMKDEFVSTVSHELRTPLTSIKGSLGLITGGATGEIPAEAKTLLTVMDNNTERLLFLINDLLDSQKIESGEFEMEFTELELISVIKQSVADNQSYAEQHKVKIIFENQNSDEIWINGNETRLMQVMANLLSNAAKFSPAEAKVEVVIDKNNDSVRVSVVDHGQGVDEVFRETLFDKFTQQDSSDIRQKGGTGLGLSITKTIVEKHGGTIDYLANPEQGSTFYFELPLIKK